MSDEPPRKRSELEEYLDRPLSPEEREALLRTVEASRRYEAAEAQTQQDTVWQARLRRIWGPLVPIAVLLAKFGGILFKAKFLFSIFVTIGAYTIFWGWRFAVGFVLLILIHEIGHVLEAKRQGLHVTAPTFIPFFGAYVLHERATSAYRGALIALAGPLVGGLGAAACWGLGAHLDSDLFRALAYVGFFLNLINLLPIGFLDGGRVIDVVNPLLLLVGVVGLGLVAWHSHNGLLVIVLAVVAVYLWYRWRKTPSRAGDPYYEVKDWQPTVITILYGGITALLLLGMVATEVARPT
jgi:Zn-dependent protease